ncbi:MAG TPA: glycine betaine ABC transporter substrate-binding protein [Terriglobales bacterium]|nr:glycine betaine ABC transporter substrate-binding protein [Terriglobales bacterium]
MTLTTQQPCHPERSRGTLCSSASVVMQVVAIVVLIAVLLSCGPPRTDRIVIGTKNFTEQLVLGELFAQQIENKTHLKVERRFYLAGTYICHQSILAGRIDIYPEYTGTALTAILKQPPKGTKEEVYNEIKSEYAKHFNLAIGQPLGFNDTFAMQIRGEDARKLNIKTISDAAKHAPLWHAGFGYEFMERPDGYKGLAQTYNLHFAEEPRIMDLGLLGRALKEKQVDITAGNSTDGLIYAFDFYVLEDDRHYFPPYEAVPIIRTEALTKHPEVKAALDELTGKITEEDMRQLNYAVDGQHLNPTDVVREFLKVKGL